ncbi:hypothetical protein OF83DRAFT_1175706 [Amylostereum chailletii]|nr:hypothetical protein OF83DRAFT_1175706 [Amylostereum chailletii]
MATRKPFHGLKRGLVIAIDLGTTYSGISYAILDPGHVPEIRPVTRYPGQDAGDSKIPTVVWYDHKGKVLAAGAEEPEMDYEEDWPSSEPLKVEWFKLLLRPQTPSPDNVSIPTPTLPPSRDVIGIFADFYRYMYDRAKAYIRETNVNGDSLWNSVQGDINIVLSHPNGWGGPQQNAMRRAAIMAGMVPDTLAGKERITFVSEGEASFHYCVSKGLMADAVEVGKNVMVVDAGGGTVDLSTYSFTQRSPIKIAEIAPPDCIIQGSVIVRQRAHDYLKSKLKDSRFGQKSYLDSMCEIFDQTAKKRFKGVGDSTVKFSNMLNDRDPKVLCV